MISHPPTDAQNERHNHSPGRPGVLSTTRYKSVEQGCRGWDEYGSSKKVDSCKGRAPAWVSSVVYSKEDNHEKRATTAMGMLR